MLLEHKYCYKYCYGFHLKIVQKNCDWNLSEAAQVIYALCSVYLLLVPLGTDEIIMLRL